MISIKISLLLLVLSCGIFSAFSQDTPAEDTTPAAPLSDGETTIPVVPPVVNPDAPAGEATTPPTVGEAAVPTTTPIPSAADPAKDVAKTETDAAAETPVVEGVTTPTTTTAKPADGPATTGKTGGDVSVTDSAVTTAKTTIAAGPTPQPATTTTLKTAPLGKQKDEVQGQPGTTAATASSTVTEHTFGAITFGISLATFLLVLVGLVVAGCYWDKKVRTGRVHV